jgi:hypothetical protein
VLQNRSTNDFEDDEWADDRFQTRAQSPFPRNTSKFIARPIPGAYHVGLYTSKPELTSKTPDLESFHVFTWIAAVLDSAKPLKASSSSEKPSISSPAMFEGYTLNVNRYERAKSEVGAFLNSRLNLQEMKAYRSTTEKAVADISILHESLVHGFEGNNVDPLYDRSTKAEFAWAAKTLLAFFFPLDTEDTVVHKYWGGVHDILSLPVRNRLLLVTLSKY